MMGRLRAIAASLHRELRVYRGVMRDPRTPLAARVMLAVAVGYALLPIDLVPDWLPVVGQLDDLVLVPLLVFVALRFMPGHVMRDHRTLVGGSSRHSVSPARAGDYHARLRMRYPARGARPHQAGAAGDNAVSQ